METAAVPSDQVQMDYKGSKVLTMRGLKDKKTWTRLDKLVSETALPLANTLPFPGRQATEHLGEKRACDAARLSTCGQHTALVYNEAIVVGELS